jgi:hypothetical protein
MYRSRRVDEKAATLRYCIVGTVVAAFVWWVPATSEASSPNPRCWDGRLIALKAGEFSGPLLCEGEHVSFKLAGVIKGTKKSYLVYDYRYQFIPEGGKILHGGQRVVVMSLNGRYLGQYALTPPPPFDVVVKKSSIVILIGGDARGVIEFKDGPPISALIDGEKIAFFK